jgi:hypothetical protein
MNPTARELGSAQFGSVKLDLVSVRIINETFINTIICSNNKCDVHEHNNMFEY